MSEVLTAFSNELAALTESTGHSVVRVEGRRRLPASGIIWSDDGVIVTANHVVERDDNLMIGLPNGDKVAATLIGRDPSTDLAALRVTATGLTAIKKANFESLRAGSLVLALGRPGKAINATLGVVSALGDTNADGENTVDRYVQTDVTMFPGFSGGPLVGMDGGVLGINTSAMRDISLTIPLPTIARVVESLLAHGKIRRGYLGVGTQPVRLPPAIRTQLDQETGLLVASVEADSPAEQGGLMIGDTLIALGTQSVRSVDELSARLSSEVVGAATDFTILRGGQIQHLHVTIGERK